MSDQFATADAVRDLIATLSQLENRFRGGDHDLDDQQILEGYKWMFSILQVALDTQLWADPANPRFVDIVGPYKKWGGDNSDAFYQFSPIDPDVTYRVHGRTGDAVYLSLTVYGGPRDGHYSERIVGTLNNRDHFDIGPDGKFEAVLARTRPVGYTGAFLELADDAVAAITRDYLEHPESGERCSWVIEAVDPPTTYREDDSDLARRFRTAITWLEDQSQMVPLGLGTLNHVDDPYPVAEITFGWAAGDAAYAMGSFDLSDDQALILRGRSPECAFWNCCLWNQFMHTYNYDYERVTINGAQTVYEDDGSWTLVVAACDPGHPNWLSTAGHPRGRIWFRWFYPAVTPQTISAEVVDISSVPRFTGSVK
ncbi:MAG: DUF1214 domain-containing protein [Acidimicrobiia bacterium]|nr:DUF1214 domain-containing protein [Acidimicrobiia bacterium]